MRGKSLPREIRNVNSCNDHEDCVVLNGGSSSSRCCHRFKSSTDDSNKKRGNQRSSSYGEKTLVSRRISHESNIESRRRRHCSVHKLEIVDGRVR